MLYMVQLEYPPEHRDAALRYFWAHGTTRYEGNVVVKDAWVATQDHVAYALVDAEDDDEITKASAPLEQFGTLAVQQVTSIDEI